MHRPLASVTISGFRSIESLTVNLASDVTMLVGANGSGKSNIIGAFELLGYAIDRRLQAHVERIGGFNRMLHRSPADAETDAVLIEAWGADDAHHKGGRVSNGYRLRLEPAADDTVLVREVTLTHHDIYPRPYEESLGSGRESRLREVRSQHPANQHLLDALEGLRVFHFDDTSLNAPPLTRTDVGDGETLHADARNIAAVLLEMRDAHPERYDAVLRSVRSVAPFFDDFVLRPTRDTVLLQWRERGLDDTFSGSQLSSGTLRFICLTVLLTQPVAPSTVVLDEPELGLHPAALRHLSDQLRRAGRERRILAATQSVTLLRDFSIDEVAVVERVRGATTLDRPDPASLEAWLDSYTLGELWEMNLLGGRPRSAAAPTRSA